MVRTLQLEPRFEQSQYRSHQICFVKEFSQRELNQELATSQLSQEFGNDGTRFKATLANVLSDPSIRDPHLAFDSFTGVVSPEWNWKRLCGEKGCMKVLCPELCPGQIVMMDNAKFHKSPRIHQTVENGSCRLLYLPAYSPDLNSIGHYWA
jgi:hypothetical protein